MAPLALTFSLLGFWLALGWAVQALVKPQLAPLTSLLLAPLIGFSATLVPVFWLSLIGMHAAHFALPLTIVLAALAAVGWAVRRPSWRLSYAVPVAVVALALLATGIPTLVFGFDWVANANDDWANYNLGALRLIEHGMLHRPDVDAMLAGKDYPGYFYFLTVGQDVRPGSELMLAWLGALSRQNPFFIFMPLILAFDGVMMCAAAALALIGARSRLHWFIGLLLAAAAPLSLYAIQQQLIAQVIGIAFTCGMAALTCIRLTELVDWRRLMLVTLVASAYLLAYPEMVPFYGLAFLLFHIAHAGDRTWGWSRSGCMLLVPVGLAILTGPYIFSAVLFMLNQFTQSAVQGRIGDVSIFPYFVVPSGIAMLWGFLPLGIFSPEPWLSIAIIGAIVLSIWTFVGAIFRMYRGSVTASILIVFVLVTVQLAFKRNDFGLFKIAMFAQPFLWFTLINAVVNRRVVPILLAVGLGSTSLYTDFQMTEIALRDGSGGGIGITGASRAGLLHKVLGNSDPKWCDTAFETADLPLIKVLAARPGCSRIFPTRLTFAVLGADKWRNVNPLHRISGIDDFVSSVASRLTPKLADLSFKRLDGSYLNVKYFDFSSHNTENVGVSSSDESVINSLDSKSIMVNKKSHFADHLVFIESSLGDHYYIPNFSVVSMYATEPDIFFDGKVFQAVGRYMLFKLIEPSQEIRLLINISTTAMSGDTRPLPPATVMGEDAVKVGLNGNGSARVLSPPVKPLVVGHDAYILLDLGTDAKPIVRPRIGAMSLYGTRLPVDYRSLTAFARRISAVDAADCKCDAAPSSITDIKVALADPTLRYSGIYEDGWIGQNGFARLAADRPGKVEFRAMMPGGIGLTKDEITVAVEGGESVTRSVVPGDIAVDVPVAAGPHRISWHFATAGVLPDGDDRAAAASLRSLAIVQDVGDAGGAPHSMATPR